MNAKGHPQPVLPHKCVLGEGPVWDAHKKRILWVDILQGEIHQYSTVTGQHKTFSAGQMVGSVALRQSGGIIAALQHGFAFIDLDTGSITPILDPEAHLPHNRFNDGKVDPEGRFWAGTMSLIDQPRTGSLYVLHKDLTCEPRIRNVSISNGLAWTHDRSTLYFIDTPTGGVMAYDYDSHSANITNARAVINVPETEGSPDGMTIDAEGMLWIGHWDGWQVTRWDPTTGKLLTRLPLPVGRVTSCTFGGDDMTDLYVTTASDGLSADELQQQPLAGSLFVIKDCGFKGLPPFEFGG